MTQIQTGRFDALLRGLFSIAGEWVAPGVCSELVPVVVTQPADPSHHYGRRERLASCYLSPAAVAAQYSAARIRNNIESNHVVIVSQVTMSLTANDMVRVALTELAGDLGTLGPAPTLRDTRFARYDLAGVPGPSGVITSTGSNAVIASQNVIHRSRVLANSNTYYLQPVILAPGGELTVWRETVNVGLNVGFDWLEIPLTQQQME